MSPYRSLVAPKGPRRPKAAMWLEVTLVPTEVALFILTLSTSLGLTYRAAEVNADYRFSAVSLSTAAIVGLVSIWAGFLKFRLQALLLAAAASWANAAFTASVGNIAGLLHFGTLGFLFALCALRCQMALLAPASLAPAPEVPEALAPDVLEPVGASGAGGASGAA